MKEIIRTSFIGLTILVLSTACSPSKENGSSDLSRHSPAPNELYNEIARMDSVIFDAFNTHDLEKLKTIFSENLEFYHDKDGLAGYEQTINNLKSLFEKNQHTGLRRDIIKGSLEVYPIKDYGAVEICLHRFCHVENGKDDCGVFKNIMIWENKNGVWKVTRVVSYDH
jgi:Domain of unknown function (DUF4440)